MDGNSEIEETEPVEVPEWLRTALTPSSASWYAGLTGPRRDVMQMFAILAAMRNQLMTLPIGRLADIALADAQSTIRAVYEVLKQIDT